MRLARIGPIGQEKPAVIVDDHAILVDDLVSDWSRHGLEAGGLDAVTGTDLSGRPRIDLDRTRIGPPLTGMSKIVCAGLNYSKHAAEVGATPPTEPVIFLKTTDCIVGPHDDIVIPPGSTTTDYEVELAIVIGKPALYLDSPEQSADHILGYTISQDISERSWQTERGTQWDKGKSFPTFNPLGPVIVVDGDFDPHNARLWCGVDDEIRQDSRTDDLIFGIDHLVWYVSQFTQLHPGDVINTGTPSGVAMGTSPANYLRDGQLLRTGIDGIGEMRAHLVAHSSSSTHHSSAPAKGHS